MEDLYFEKDYGRLYEKIEGGVCEEYEFVHSLGTIRHMYIKRKVPIPAKGGPYFDLVTPYGYGGPLILNSQDENIEQLVKEFEMDFQAHCLEQKIVSEFVRFYPLSNNALHFSSCYQNSFRSKTTGTLLKPFDDPVQEEFSRSTRKSIRKALKEGVEYKITVNPDSLVEFQKIYHATMKRIGANELYFFDQEYFAKCLNYFGKNILLVEAIFEKQTIGMEMHFVYKNKIHTHLSGTLEEFHHLSPVYVMTYAIALWGKENGIDLIHSGGGRTSDPDDSLYQFKKKFGKNTEFEYFTGQRIWNKEIYDYLCDVTNVKEKENFFPAYRSNEIINSK